MSLVTEDHYCCIYLHCLNLLLLSTSSGLYIENAYNDKLVCTRCCRNNSFQVIIELARRFLFCVSRVFFCSTSRGINVGCCTTDGLTLDHCFTISVLCDGSGLLTIGEIANEQFGHHLKKTCFRGFRPGKYSIIETWE